MDWLRNYRVLLVANTSKAWSSRKIREEIQFLDWDFRKAKYNFWDIAYKHLLLTREIRPRLVMAPDIMHNDTEEKIRRKLEYIDKLMKYVDRVVIPIHKYSKLLKDYELGYPNSPSFSPENAFWVYEIQDQVTHLLGGSPHRQAMMLKYFPNVKSLDGNTIFRAAVSYGKIWYPEKPHWRRPKKYLGYAEIFRRSALNVIKFWRLR